MLQYWVRGLRPNKRRQRDIPVCNFVAPLPEYQAILVEAKMSGPQPGWKVMGCWGTLGLWPCYIQSTSIIIHLYPAILFRWIFQYPWQETCQTLLSGSTPPRRPARTAAEAGEIRRDPESGCRSVSPVVDSPLWDAHWKWRHDAENIGFIWIYMNLLDFRTEKIRIKAGRAPVRTDWSFSATKASSPSKWGEVFCSASTTLLVFFCIRSKDMRRQRR